MDTLLGMDGCIIMITDDGILFILENGRRYFIIDTHLPYEIHDSYDTGGYKILRYVPEAKSSNGMYYIGNSPDMEFVFNCLRGFARNR